MTNLNIQPYFDDFDETKNFHQILFKPGLAVQSRELTQLQTIIKNQVRRFGDHIFKDGSIVAGSGVSLVTNLVAIPCDPILVGGTTPFVPSIQFPTLLDQPLYIVNTTKGFEAQIRWYSEGVAPKIFVDIKVGNNAITGEKINLAADDEFYVYDQVNYDIYRSNAGSANDIITIKSTGNYTPSTVAFVDSGVTYVAGNFIYNEKQAIVVSDTTDASTAIVGFDVNESFVTAYDDVTLLDPANGSSNYAAPGADRLYHELTLDVKSWNGEPDVTFEKDFVELVRVKNGVIQNIRSVPIYSAIMDTIARRTHDESGNYDVRPFTMVMSDHPTDSNKIIGTVSAGKAYVKGYEIDKIASTEITFDRARDTENVVGFNISSYYGNYVKVAFPRTAAVTFTNATEVVNWVGHGLTAGTPVKFYDGPSGTMPSGLAANTVYYVINPTDNGFQVSTTQGGSVAAFTTDGSGVSISTNAVATALATLPDFTSPSKVDIHSVAHPINDTTKIGTAFIRGIEYVSPSVYNVFLFDIVMTSSNFGAARSLIVGTAAAPSFRLPIDASGIVAGVTQLYETDRDIAIFPVPQPYVHSYTGMSYNIRRSFFGQAITTSTASIQTLGGSERFVGASGGNVPAGIVNSLYTVFNRQTGQIIDMSTGGRSVTIPTVSSGAVGQAVFNFAASDHADGATIVDIYATIDVTNDSRKSKTHQTFANFAINNVIPGNRYSLGRVDAISCRIFQIENDNEDCVLPGTFTTSGGIVTITVDTTDIIEDDLVFVEFANAPHLADDFVVLDRTATYFTIASTEVSGAGSCNVVLLGNTTGSGRYKDVTGLFTFDGGQRDHYYDTASITALAGAPGKVRVFGQSYIHGAGRAIYAVDSYQDYDRIPSYKARRTGVTYDLRDCLDFRFDRVDSPPAGAAYTVPSASSFASSVNQLPTQFGSVEADYSYYLSRVDKLILMNNGQFRVARGISSLNNPLPPSEEANGMTLFEVAFGAYTPEASKVIPKAINNRRYTMRDIGKIDQRVQQLEYYTALSVLEKETQNKNLYDSAGGSIFTNGFSVDSFTSNNYVDLENHDNRCTIDFQRGRMFPTVTEKLINLQWTSGTASKWDTVVMCPPTGEEIFISQTTKTSTININPYNVLTYSGSMTLSPSSDFWVDTVTNPSWNIVQGNTTITDFGVRRVNIGTGVLPRLASITSVNEVSTQDTVIGNELISTNLTPIPWVRANKVKFTISGVRPGTVLNFFFDGRLINQYVQKTGEAIGAPVKTLPNGTVTGIIHIPNNNTHRFVTGNNHIYAMDAESLEQLNAQSSYADATYTTNGTLRTQNTLITLRRDTTINRGVVRTTVWYDPLAQSFLVDDSFFKLGVFVTKVDLYFAKKDPVAPVMIQIRPTVNGYPSSSEIIPYSQVTLQPENVNVSSTGNVPTTFTFEAPVHLPPGEFALVVL